MRKFRNLFVGKAVELLTGVNSQQIETVLDGDPIAARDHARKLLGLSTRDMRTIQSIKKLTPTGWSLRYLNIPRKVYEDYLKQLDRIEREQAEEYPDIKLDLEAQEIREKFPKVDGYINFQRSLIKVCRPVFSHTKDWRYIDPIIHLEIVKDTLDIIMQKGTMTLAEVFKMNVHLYYASFNAIMGTKIYRENKLAA